MKKILALLTAALTLGVAAPSTALAGHDGGCSSRVAYRCNSCGTGVQQVRYVAGYDRDGCAIYRWRTVSHYCRPRHDHGHGHSHSSRGRGHSSQHGHGR